MKNQHNPEDDLTDEMLMKYIKLAQLEDQTAYKILIDYFEKDIKGVKKRSKLWVPGYDDEDLYQECK